MIMMLVRLNNFFIRLFKRTFSAQDVLILLPYCLQQSECDADIETDIQNCRRCNKCVIAKIAALCDERHLKIFIVAGGQRAIQKIKQEKPKLIIAVACDKELILGLASVFPTPVFAVENSRPNGPCKNTCVDIASLRQAVERFVRS